MDRRQVLKTAAATPIVAIIGVSEGKLVAKKCLGTYKVCAFCNNCGTRFGWIKIPKGISTERALCQEKCPECEIKGDLRMSHGNPDIYTLEWANSYS